MRGASLETRLKRRQSYWSMGSSSCLMFRLAARYPSFGSNLAWRRMSTSQSRLRWPIMPSVCIWHRWLKIMEQFFVLTCWNWRVHESANWHKATVGRFTMQLVSKNRRSSTFSSTLPTIARISSLTRWKYLSASLKLTWSCMDFVLRILSLDLC